MEEKEDTLPIEMQRCSAVTPGKDNLLEPNFQNDVKLLDDEEFDFDLAVSPSKSKNHRPSVGVVEDEDEIFFGPVGYREKVAAKVVEEREIRPLSPLNEKQQAELFVEAQKVALMLKAEARKENPSPQNSPKLLSLPEITVTDSPVALKRKPTGPFTLDFDSPDGEKQEEVVPPKRVCKELGTDNSVKENAGSRLQRSRSLRMPTARKFGASDLPHKGSGLKRPMVQKRERTVSENSPVRLSVSHNTSGVSPSKKAKLSVPASKLLQTKSPHLISEPRRSPRLSITTNQRIKSPPKPTLSKPQIKKPSGLQAPQTKTLPTAKPSLLKGPISKLELIKPRKLQAPKGLKPESGLPSVGPMKAGPMKASNMDKSLSTSSWESPEPQPLKPRQLSHMTTPVKKEKLMAPKKLITHAETESAGLVTPKRSNSSSSLSAVFATPATPQSVSQSAKRRSFLPTPGRSTRSSMSSAGGSSVFRGSSASSASSMESPAPLSVGMSPAVGILVDLSDLNSTASSTASGLSPPKASRSRVVHTPLIKEAPASGRKPGGWTPVRRARPTAPEDEYIVCTKRFK